MTRSGDKDEKSDRSRFERAMEGVKPLPKGSARGKSRTQRTSPSAPLPTPAPLEIQREGERIEGWAPGFDRRRLRRLRRGEIAMDVRLDLHGCLADEAEARLRATVDGALAAQERCILVIHGRGLHSEDGPVLKYALLDWVQTPAIRPHVLALSTACPRDGGSGATYILLRRPR